MNKKISLFLMGYKGFKVLEFLILNGYKNLIDKVITTEDKNIIKDYYREIKELCMHNKINCFHRKSDYKINTQYAIAISWRWLINTEKFNLITIHDSLLPKYRGFSPLVNALIKGEENIGATAIFAEKRYDEGDIILQKKITINYPIKIKEAIEKISFLYIEIVRDIFELIINNKPLPRSRQNNDLATYSLWRDFEDYFINWANSNVEIKRFVDAVGFPYLGAKTYMNDKIITITDVEVVPDVKIENRDVGKVIFIEDVFPIVVCGKGLIKILEAYDENNNSILPLKKFRIKFTSKT